MKTNQLDDVDLDTCFDIFGHPYLEEGMANLVADRMDDLVTVNKEIKGKILERIKQTPVTSRNQNFWNATGATLVNKILNLWSDTKTDWLLHKDYLDTLVDKLIEGGNGKEKDIKSLFAISGGIDSFLHSAKKSGVSEVIDMEKSMLAVKVLLEAYYMVDNSFHPSWKFHPVHVINSLLSQSPEHSKQAVINTGLNGEIKKLLEEWKDGKPGWCGYPEEIKILEHLNTLVTQQN